MSAKFMLVLFSTDPIFIRQVVAAGVGGVIVDWEYIGKEDRQSSADTQINPDTVDDLRRVRTCTEATVICRLNSYNSATTVEEVEQAIEAGADELLLPMVRTLEEVEAVIDQVRRRCGVGILIETLAAVGLAEELAYLPLSRAYVGLNDLAIERNTPNIFTTVVDGTLEHIRRSLFHIPFGFGGLTLPDLGHPIPCRLLISEMARLKCDFSFLRRSFYRDIWGRDPAVESPRLLEALRQARLRSPDAVARDRKDLEAAVRAWSAGVGCRRKVTHD
jgi:hypothetical protein